MGVISESAVWEDSVLQIEVGDSVGGGPLGVANLQAQDLANRTKWLKDNKVDITAVASTTAKGVVELATEDEVKAGTDTDRAITPAGFKAAFGEFYPTGLESTYVDENNFSVTGDQTAIFTKGRVLKITDSGGTVYAVVSASVYDTVTTVTIAGSTIDSEISDVLCSVRQKTSDVWESGSNANGTYIKWTDGTMICRKSITTDTITNAWGALYQSNCAAIGTYPASFVGDIPYVHMQCIQGAGGLSIPAMGASGGLATGPLVALVRPSSHAYTGVVLITAIGRWF